MEVGGWRWGGDGDGDGVGGGGSGGVRVGWDGVRTAEMQNFAPRRCEEIFEIQITTELGA